MSSGKLLPGPNMTTAYKLLGIQQQENGKQLLVNGSSSSRERKCCRELRGSGGGDGEEGGGMGCRCFRMPLHYPRYKKADYESMPEWKLDCLLTEYGLPLTGDLSHKRNFAMGAFLWPSQY